MFNFSEADAAALLPLKRRLMLLISLFLLVLILFFGAKFINELKNSRYIGQGVMPTKMLSASADGEIVVKPDIAQVSFVVVRRSASASDAQKQNSEAINRVVAYLKKAGVEDKDVKTQNYNIYPLYDYVQNQGQVFKGYEVRQELAIKIRNLDKVGDVLTDATENGINEVHSFRLTIDEEEKVREEARALAIKNARAKAETLAKDLGVRLGQLVSFNESGSGGTPLPLEYAYGKGGGDAMGPSPAIPTGENKIVISVMLAYEMK